MTVEFQDIGTRQGILNNHLNLIQELYNRNARYKFNRNTENVTAGCYKQNVKQHKHIILKDCRVSYARKSNKN